MFEPGAALTLDSAKVALNEGLRAIDTGETVIDLAKVLTLDSVAVAVLLAWQRKAQALGTPLGFVNPPLSLTSLAELYGVTALLHFPVEAVSMSGLPRH